MAVGSVGLGRPQGPCKQNVFSASGAGRVCVLDPSRRPQTCLCGKSMAGLEGRRLRPSVLTVILRRPSLVLAFFLYHTLLERFLCNSL